VHFLVTTLIKDLRRRLADPIALILWIGIPLVIGWLMTLAMGGDGGGVPKAKVLLVDQDDSFLTQLLEGAGSNSESFLDIERVELDEGRARLDRGEGSALLILPAGFTQALLEEQPVELQLITNPAQFVLPRIIEEGLEMMIEACFYVHRLFGESLRTIAAGPPGGGDFFTNMRIAQIAADINTQLQNLDVALFPPVIKVEDEPQPEAVAGETKPKTGIGALLLPSILFMSLLFIAQGVSEDIWKERNQGTLRRLYVTPQTAALFLLGKLLAGTAVMLVISAVGLVAGWLFLGLASSNAPLALVWCAFAGTVLLVFFTLLQTLAKNERAGNVLTSIVLFPLMMVGGSFFPLEAMPSWMAAIGRQTPNGLALTRLNELLRDELAMGDLARTALILFIPAAIAFALALRRLRSAFLN